MGAGCRRHTCYGIDRAKRLRASEDNTGSSAIPAARFQLPRSLLDGSPVLGANYLNIEWFVPKSGLRSRVFSRCEIVCDVCCVLGLVLLLHVPPCYCTTVSGVLCTTYHTTHKYSATVDQLHRRKSAISSGGGVHPRAETLGTTAAVCVHRTRSVVVQGNNGECGHARPKRLIACSSVCVEPRAMMILPLALR